MRQISYVTYNRKPFQTVILLFYSLKIKDIEILRKTSTIKIISVQNNLLKIIYVSVIIEIKTLKIFAQHKNLKRNLVYNYQVKILNFPCEKNVLVSTLFNNVYNTRKMVGTI